MRQFIKRFGTVLKWGTFLATLAFIACILLQIFARLFLTAAPSWTEEAARLFFVLAVGFASGLALRGGDYVHFDFLVRRLSPVGRRRVLFGVDLTTAGLFLIFTVYAARFMWMGWAESSPSLKFPMAIAFAGTLILGISVSVYAVYRLGRYRSTPPQ